MSWKEKVRHWLRSRAFVVYMSTAIAGVVLTVGMIIVLLVAGNVPVVEVTAAP